MEVVSERYDFKYTLVAELDDTISDFRDERLIYLLTSELLGQHLDSYDGLKNPIIKLTKRYNDAGK